jgi:GntR family transcriptional repressor for pyruvate dehydrogenase complex
MTDSTVPPATRSTPIRRPLTGLPRTPAAKGTTVDRVTAVLVDHIRRHRLAPGSVLPSEVQMSTELGVSRGAVREAYRSLSQAGLVEITNGRSPRVGLISKRALLQLVQHALWTQQASIEQILDLRRSIEEYAAGLAAVHRTEEDIAQLRRAVAGLRAAGRRADPYVRADIRFHEIIGLATGNPLIALVTGGLREAMGASIRVSLAGRQSAAELGRVVATHAQVVDAIEAGRAADARRLMARHFDEALTSVRRQAVPNGSQPTSGPVRPARRRAAR